MSVNKTGLALKISTLTVLEICDDKVIRALCDLESDDASTAVTAYFSVFKTLALNNQSLGEYIRDLILYGHFPLMYRFFEAENDIIYELLTYDLFIIKKIFDTSSLEIKNRLFEKFNLQELSRAPVFDMGEFDFDADYFVGFLKKNGMGIYAKYRGFLLQQGEITPVKITDSIRFRDLKEYRSQINKLRRNTEAFIKGMTAQNVLLYGDRGTGKSSAVKALINEYPEIRIIGAAKSDVSYIPGLYEQLSLLPLKFILFFDDLTFSPGEAGYNTFKQILEGSLLSKPSNILVYATTNRRHIVKETAADRDRDSFHRGDELDELSSLADRFGLYITYSLPDKDLYLRIAREIAGEAANILSEEEFIIGAERFALSKGGRSPRAARQFVETLLAQGVI